MVLKLSKQKRYVSNQERVNAISCKASVQYPVQADGHHHRVIQNLKQIYKQQQHEINKDI
jgi:hypothetical protein